MKLSENEFNDWCRKNQISAEAKLIIQRIRTSEPSRRVKSGAWSVSGAFPSRKMEVTIQYESHKNELPFIHELEHDPEVLEFYDQPCEIKLNFLTKKGTKTGSRHTPDFFVIKRSEAVFVECKTEDDLLELTLKNPARYQLDETGNWICPPGKEYAESVGLDYYLRSSKEISWIFQRNIEFLDDYYRNNKFNYDKEEYIEILEIVKNSPAITLEQLFLKIEKVNASSREDVHNLIANDAIYVDLHSQPLTEPKTVCLYANKEVASAYSNLALTITQPGDELLKPNKVDLSVNKEVLWDGKAWKIVNVGESEITLIDENNNSSEIKLILFEKFILNGKVQGIAESGEPDFHEHIDKHPNRNTLDHHLAERNFVFCSDAGKNIFYLLFEPGK